MSQILKIVFLNAFIVHRMYEKRDFFSSVDSFKSLDKYRDVRNNVQLAAHFMVDLVQELIQYACSLQLRVQQEDCSDVGSTEAQRLMQLTSRRKQKCLDLFNSLNDRNLRLEVPEYIPKQGKLHNCTSMRKVQEKAFREAIERPIVAVNAQYTFAYDFIQDSERTAGILIIQIRGCVLDL